MTEENEDMTMTDSDQRLIGALFGVPRPRMIAIVTEVNPEEWKGYYADDGKKAAKSEE